MKTLLKKYAPLKWYICLLIILLATSIVGIVYVVYVNFYFCETLIYTGTPPFTWGVDEGWGTNVLFYLADAVFTWMMWLSMGLIFRALKNNSIVDNRFLNVQFLLPALYCSYIPDFAQKYLKIRCCAPLRSTRRRSYTKAAK